MDLKRRLVGVAAVILLALGACLAYGVVTLVYEQGRSAERTRRQLADISRIAQNSQRGAIHRDAMPPAGPADAGAPFRATRLEAHEHRLSALEADVRDLQARCPAPRRATR